MDQELGSKGFQTITDYLSADHQRLDHLFDEAVQACGCGALYEARSWFGRFHAGLKRHIDCEESTVFPVFLERTRIVGPIEVMRREHRQIEKLLLKAREALDRDDTSAFSEAAGSLRELIQSHNRKEERILYPKTDAALSPDERASLAARLERA